MTATTSVTPTGDQSIDGMLYSDKWATGTLSYGFPASYWDYEYTLGYGVVEGTFSFNAAQMQATQFALDRADGNSANNGFSVEGFTSLDFQLEGGSATLRYANTTSPEVYTAFAFYPNAETYGGDSWFGPYAGGIYLNPVPGNYAWHTHLHEIGTSLGLSHPHENEGGFGPVPYEEDSMENSILSYRSYVGADINTGYTNETWGYAQTFMMLDIAALQSMYGADYSTNSSDTTYVWTPDGGNTVIDGQVAITPGANRIFLTVWDGGGNDTFDLGAYETDIQVSLKPGDSSLFYIGQAAVLGDGRTAAGNVYNAMLFEGDKRSLIENAAGGSGNDTISGNSGRNELTGNAGGDQLDGLRGKDTIFGKAGQDKLWGGAGDDDLHGNNGNDTVRGEDGNDSLDGAKGDDTLKGGEGNDEIIGGTGQDSMAGGDDADVLKGWAGRDILNGNDGNDTLKGNDHADLLNGGDGNDRMQGNEGNDTFVFSNGDDLIKDFEATNDKEDVDLGEVDSITSFSDLQDNHMTQVGKDVVIDDLNGNTLTLLDVALSDLGKADFLF